MYNLKQFMSMKKSLFILPLAALALAACSSDEITSQAQQTQLANGDQLSIYPSVQGTTRATSTTTATISDFNVIITGDFQDGDGTDAADITNGLTQKVEKTSGKWGFQEGTEYWWKNKTSPATFQAWSPAALAESDLTAYQVKSAIADQEDLLVAYNAGTREDFDAGVPMNFQHVMSQILVKAYNSDPTAVEVKIAGVKLVNIADQADLTLPTVKTTADDFNWSTATYTPWSTPSGTAAYSNGSANATNTSYTTLSTAQTDLFGEPMLLMPQKLTAANLTQNTTNGATLSNTYLAILVNVKSKVKTVFFSEDGHVYKDNGSGGQGDAIAFDGDRDSDGTDDCYTTSTWEGIKAGKIGSDDLYKVEPVLYPRKGYGTVNNKFAYVGVALDTQWKPGYKYTYTLHFSKDGIGKSISDFPEDYETDGNWPYGKDPETGEPNNPGEDIVDNPTQLFFTVTVDEWIDADPINKDM